ncbi:SMI1/KNR4 family protein [Methanobrevibacter smithii]|uniref:hypothetical protein n=1 Tax=Methanobrevibacter smithii TaxID=2173 RepID=UPI000360D63E|nr:hypothetical protein [Methanobrevibacter smithii]
MTKLTENERKALNNACARLRETNLGTKIGNIEDFLDIDILKTDANTVSKAIDELFDKWANPLLNITVPPPGFFTLAGDAEGNLWCYCNDETNPPIFEHDETTGDLYLNIASEDGANSYQVHVGNYIAVKHLNDYYKKTEIDSKLGGKSNVGHNHDERYYTETEIDAKVNNINSQINSLIGFTATIVNSLPATGEVGVMYLKLNTSASVEGNIYDEYIWVNNKFEKIGSTETTVDLSGYVTQTEMNTQLANKANINHGHLSRDIEINPDVEDGMWASEYGINRQTDVNCYVYDHEKKLENIDDGANKTVVDSSLSSSSTNPVQNKVVNSALNGKSNTGHEHTSDEIHYAYDQNVSVTTILENKAAKNHTHNYIPSTVSQTVFGSGDSKVTATRQGNVVTLRLYLAGEFTESWKQWCTITDSQYLPDTDGGFTDFGISSSYGTHMLLRINSDGRVRTGYGQNKTSYCYQTITFLKNN